MLRIQEDQIIAIEQLTQKRFETKMIDHAKWFSPNLSKILGESGVGQVIRAGIKQAKNYGFTNQGPVQLYIELMFTFGSEFDTDPQLPWSTRALGDLQSAQGARSNELYEQATIYLNKIAGPSKEYSIKAARRLAVEGWSATDTYSEGYVPSILNQLYPQKFEYLGDRGIHLLIGRGRTLARSFGIYSNRGIALFTSLMFLLGHGFATDPLFPWARSTLSDAEIRDADERVNRLEEGMRSYCLFEPTM